MLIRPYAPADADEVNAVARSAFAQYEGIYKDWDILIRGVGAMASLAEQGEIIVAEDHRVVGAVCYCPPASAPRAAFFEREWPIIRMLVVDPNARGQGIGRKLTEECIRRAAREEANLIALHTSPAMQTALAMYVRMGFTLTRRVPDRFGVPYGVYTLSLTPTQASASSPSH